MVRNAAAAAVVTDNGAAEQRVKPSMVYRSYRNRDPSSSPSSQPAASCGEQQSSVDHRAVAKDDNENLSRDDSFHAGLRHEHYQPWIRGHFVAA